MWNEVRGCQTGSQRLETRRNAFGFALEIRDWRLETRRHKNIALRNKEHCEGD